MLKAVFFDAAGTLIAPREPVAESYSRIARGYGVTTAPAQVNAAFRRVFHDAPGLAFGPGHAGDELIQRERNWWRAVVADTFIGLGNFTDFDAYFDELFAFFAAPANWIAPATAKRSEAQLVSSGT
jgi:putative hydrolase of the HAD superfamily